MKICILANTARYIWNFRVNLMEALRNAGHEVMAISPDGQEVALLRARGFFHEPIGLSPRGTNPIREIGSVLALRNILRKHNIDIVLSSTPKGNLYTALARTGNRCKQIANVSGLGSSYLNKNWVTSVVNSLYKLTFTRINHVFFENPSDKAIFQQNGWVSDGRSEVIPGLGVDLGHFHSSPKNFTPEARITFLMISRIIGDKGVREYVNAARVIKASHPNTCFWLLGDTAAENPTRIDPQELREWTQEGVLQHFDHSSDVRPYIIEADCIVLPSYREGMSRTLLEAGAMARPLIATDVPGCREAVDAGRNGFLCSPRDHTSLASAMLKFINLSPTQRMTMAAHSRKKMEMEFSEEIVISRYLRKIEQLTAPSA